MSEAPTDSSTFAALVREASAWDGDPAAARRLRSALRALAMPSGKRERADDAAERALLIARSAYDKLRPPELKRFVADSRLAAAFGPFLGDPAMGPWPFDEPLLIDDEEAAGWLPLVARHALIDERIRSFVTVLFRARRRELWLPASLALAKLAQRDDAMRAFVVETWQRSFPRGLPARWPDGRLVAVRRGRESAEVQDEGTAHAARHALHLACAWLAEGGSGAALGDLTAARLAAMALPANDAADASVVLLGLRVLLEDAAARAAVLSELPERAREAACDPLIDDALRHLADVLCGDDEAAPALAAVTALLAEPRWEGARGAQRLDALWSFLTTARWFQARGELGALGAMRSTSGEASAAACLAIDGVFPGGTASAVEALLPRLASVLDADVWATTAATRQATLLAELLLLFERDEVAGLPWGSLVRRAVPGTSLVPQAGSTADVARSDLALLLSGRDYHPRVLLRDAGFEERVVLHLAASQDGFVARQVAVEIERLLRRAAAAQRGRDGGARAAGTSSERPETPGEAQAKLLWRLMQRNPPTLTFRELGRVLRGSGTDLHAVVDALAALDAERDAGRPAPIIAAAYARLAGATRTLIQAAPREVDSTAGPPSVRMVEAVADALLRAASLEGEDVGGAAWLETLRGALFGTRDESGLHSWMRWLGTPAEGLEEAWERFETAAAAAHGAGALVSLEQCRELDAATHELLERLAVMSWPEADVVRQVLHAVEQRSDRWREQARRRYSEIERVTRLLDRGDDTAVLAMVERDDDLTLDLLPPEELRRIARFLLLRLRYRAASKLRARVQARAQLPGPASHVAPLFVGVSGGTLLVLDVGTAWNEVVLPGHGVGYVATVIAALMLSFLVLAGSVVSLLPRGTGPFGRRALASALRVLPTFFAAFALACGISSLVLFTLAGTATRLGPGGTPIPLAPQVVLWGSLSLFLGLFFGLILQGRSTFREG